MKLTKKQLKVIDFIKDFEEANGTTPSYREIMAGLGLSSVSAVAEHIDNLEKKGVIRKTPGAARSLEILDYQHKDTVELFRQKLETTENPEEREILERAAEILDLNL